MAIDEKALYGAATAALNARRAANGWPPTSLDKMLTADRDAWIEDIKAAILAYEAAKAAPAEGREAVAVKALAKLDEARVSIWKSYRHLAARDVALLNDAYDLLSALAHPAPAAPAEMLAASPVPPLGGG